MKRNKNTFGKVTALVGLVLSTAAFIGKIDPTTTGYLVAVGVAMIVVIEFYRLVDE